MSTENWNTNLLDELADRTRPGEAPLKASLTLLAFEPVPAAPVPAPAPADGMEEAAVAPVDGPVYWDVPGTWDAASKC